MSPVTPVGAGNSIPVSETPVSVAAAPTEEEEDEEKICRYCFEDEEEGELISPCACKGGQKYVHLSCLRRWQRMILVSQPTHPAFYSDDARHHECNVCKNTFTCEPPTRHELMASFTGPELASLIETGCIIGSHAVFDTELENQMERLHPIHRRLTSYDHWIRGVYLITVIDKDGCNIDLPITELSTLQAMRHILLTSNDNGNAGRDMVFEMRGEQLRVVRGGSLTSDNLREELTRLTTVPCSLSFKTDAAPTIGNDHVVAVNLARPVLQPPSRVVVEAAMMSACETCPGARNIQVDHYLGGPCDEEEIVCCVVAGGNGRGWTVVNKSFMNRHGAASFDGENLLSRALIIAHSRTNKRFPQEGDEGNASSHHSGAAVCLVNLQARPELNGQIGILLSFNVDSGRWLVRLADGTGKQVKPVNLEVVECNTSNRCARSGASAATDGLRVMAFWGDARWSRSQLLGEIARGHWGLCKASVSDVLITDPEEKHAALNGRIGFAPVTEMTEDFLRQSQAQMDAIHQNRLARGSVHEEQEEEKGDY